MKKPVKTLYIVLLVVVILVVVIGVAFSLFANSALKAAIESAGSKALGVKVSVEDVDLSVIGGSLGFENIVIANPANYQHDSLLELKSAKVAVEVKSLLSDEVHIKDIKLDGVDLVIEQRGITNNLHDLIKGMPSSAKAEEGVEPSGKKLHIDNLEITGVTAKVKLLPVPGKTDTVTLKLSPIKMTNLGSDNKLDAAALTGKILLAIASGIVEQGADILPKDMVNAMSSTLGKTVDIGKGILEGGKDAGKEMKDIGEGISDGLKGLFKPKKKE